jgi:hypothetical protein
MRTEDGVVTLDVELERVTAELAAAEAELIRLQARISGLRAQRETFAAAVASRTTAPAPHREGPLQIQDVENRTDAIRVVLAHVGEPMSIRQVKDMLDEHWRIKSPYPTVASTLNMLERTGRIRKVARGRYAA